MIRTMVVPSVTYGSAAQSLPRTDERFLRTEMAKTYGAVRGRSTTVRLLVEGADPALIIIEKAVMTWVCAAWDKLLDGKAMQDAWKAACIDKMGTARNARSSTQGGASALLDALERIGWTAPAVNALRTRDGIILCYGEGRVPEGGHEADPSLIRKSL